MVPAMVRLVIKVFQGAFMTPERVLQVNEVFKSVFMILMMV